MQQPTGCELGPYSLKSLARPIHNEVTDHQTQVHGLPQLRWFKSFEVGVCASGSLRSLRQARSIEDVLPNVLVYQTLLDHKYKETLSFSLTRLLCTTVPPNGV